MVRTIFSNKPVDPERNNIDLSKNKYPDSRTKIIYYDMLEPRGDMEILDYPGYLNYGGKISISWNYRDGLEIYGDTVAVCLIGYDKNNVVIDPIEKIDDQCFYRFSGAHYGVNLGNTSISNKYFETYIPVDISDMFTEVPEFYNIQLVSLDSRPPEGLTSWEGMVGYAETGKIYIK